MGQNRRRLPEIPAVHPAEASALLRPLAVGLLFWMRASSGNLGKKNDENHPALSRLANWAVLRFNSVLENIYVLFYIALKIGSARQCSWRTARFLFCEYFFHDIRIPCERLGGQRARRTNGKDNTFRHDSAAKAGLITVFSGCWFYMPSAFYFLSLCRGAWVLWFHRNSVLGQAVAPEGTGQSRPVLVVVAQRALPRC